MSFFRCVFAVGLSVLPLLSQDLTCWFPPGSDGTKAKVIADSLSKGVGLKVVARVAVSYPEIMSHLEEDKPQMAYVGSFASVILKVRNLGTPLAQKVDGKEFYSGVMISPKGADPQQILKDTPSSISFAEGASSGESSAKAATAGKAAIKMKDHLAAVNAVKAGKAKAAFVKNIWWADNKDKFPDLAMYAVPQVSEAKNPDNILWASKAVPTVLMVKLATVAKASKEAFEAREMRTFDITTLSFSQHLMRKGSIDPKSYAW